MAKLLSNITYTGRVRFQGTIYEGEHEAIIDIATYEAAQRIMAENASNGGARSRTKHFPLLRGLVRCKACGCAMHYSYTKQRDRLYGYYVCANAKTEGVASCPVPSLPAAELEAMAVEEVKTICRSKRMTDAIFKAAAADHTQSVAAMTERLQEAEQLAQKATAVADRTPADQEAQAMRRHAEVRLVEVRQEAHALQLADPSRPEARECFARFTDVWTELQPRERQELLHHLVDHIAIDGEAGTMAFTFRSEGIAAMAREPAPEALA